jgi:hypothetical protein
MACRLAEVDDSLAAILAEPSDVMKSYSATGRRGAAVSIAVAALVLLFAAAMAGTALAQDASKAVPSGGSSWDELDSVLVLPPVYRPDAADAESEPTDPCAEGCSTSSDPGIGQSPAAVAGTADNPANASAGTADNPADNPTDASAAADGSVPEESGSQQATAATGGDQQSADSVDAPLGSAQVGSPQDYEAQQAAAQELGAAGLAQAPSVIIGAPIGPYYVPGAFASGAPVFAPIRSLPTSSWMPQPMARVAPLPSLVPRGLPRTMAAFPGGGFGFRGGFPAMSGFHGGFGRR